MTAPRSAEMQKTLQKEAVASGIGLFTGEKVSLRCVPADPNTGIVFRRIDLPGKPEIPARLLNVREAPRCTRLAFKEATVNMVEHLLSALSAMQIDNLKIEVEGPEIPAVDGSSKPFVDLIDNAGIAVQSVPRSFIKIKQPVYWSEGEVHLVALPAEEFRISYTLHYPQSPLLGSQYFALSLTPKVYREEIASSRTFSLYEEIVPFIEKGIIKGGGLDNALVIKGDQILNPGGARYPNEMVRHKVLDLVGDLSLLGAPILGHILSVRSGHSSNIAFAKMISKLESC